jgi:hypothetical protein
MEKFKLDLNELRMLIQAAENNVQFASGCNHVILKLEGNNLRIYQPCAYAECAPSTLKTVKKYDPA